jgi:hypothetical protein
MGKEMVGYVRYMDVLSGQRPVIAISVDTHQRIDSRFRRR